jgi:hypothetical protein
MRWILFSSLLFINWISAFGQFNDDFSSGSLNQWSGDVAEFIINAQEELQLNAQSSSPAFIYVNAQVPESAVWEVSARLDFSPSNSNALEWILQSESAEISNLRGYGLSFGESGDEDAVEFVRYDNGNATVLGRMQNGAVASDPVQVRLRVLRSGELFTVLAAYDGSGSFTDTLIVSDDKYREGASLVTGLICNYTSTRSDLFFFDDYVLDRTQPDVSPPELLDVAVSASQIDLTYNERIDISNLEASITPGSFSLIPSLLSPARLRFSVSPDLEALEQYTMTIQLLSDLAGNVSEETEIPLFFIDAVPAEPFDVILNELMIAPSDNTPLPSEEYYELHNRSENFIQLGNLFLTDDTRSAPLPSYIIEPGEYLILCNTGDANLFESYGEVLEVDDLPTLRNSNDFIRLLDENNRFIHGVDYTDNWYKDSNKDRGWSLELLAPRYACSGEPAFAASVDPLGGSPGRANSLDTTGFRDPLLPVFASVPAENEISLRFNQWLPEDAIAPDMISITPSPGPLSNLFIEPERPNTLTAQLDQALEEGSLYTIKLKDNFPTCLLQDILDTPMVSLGIPAEPEAGDLLVSEVVFNPAVGEDQWVEIYNASNKVLDFTYIVLDFYKSSGQDRITLNLPNQILPGQYFVFTSNRNQVNEVFQAPNPLQTLEVNLPSLDRDIGAIQIWHIFGAQATALDSSCYSDAWQSGFLRSTRGVSLERLRFDFPSCEEENWQSAAESENYGTPTGPNSQQITNLDPEISGFKLLSPSFSPNSDGTEDVAVIQYQKPETTELPPRIHLNVYTPDGRLVRQPYNNFGLSQNAQLLWDGSLDSGLIAPEGFYLLQISAFNDLGETESWQGTIYLVR